jgi:hypothetical protein
MLPSRPTVTDVSAGIAIGPPSPITFNPVRVCSTPFTLTCRLPLRVYASLPSGD